MLLIWSGLVAVWVVTALAHRAAGAAGFTRMLTRRLVERIRGTALPSPARPR